MSSQRARYSRIANVRTRPVIEMDVCLVYTPDDPKLYTLNPTAWLVLELCDGRDFSSLERRYYAAVEPLRTRAAARADLRQALEDLVAMGIVKVGERTPHTDQRRAGGPNVKQSRTRAHQARVAPPGHRGAAVR